MGNVQYNDNFIVVQGVITEEMRSNVVTAAVYMVGQLKKTLGTGERTGKVYRVPGTRNATYTASAPGEAPAVQLGNLISSITHELKVDTPDELIAQVGTIMEYAKRLEFGFSDVDSLGRQYHQAPRPFMRSTYLQERDMIKRILGGHTP